MASVFDDGRMEGMNENAVRPTRIPEDEVRKRAHAIWEREGRPEGRHEDHWSEAEREIEREFGDLVGDDSSSMDALREAARKHTHAFLAATDLEDANQREASPSTRAALSTAKGKR